MLQGSAFNRGGLCERVRDRVLDDAQAPKLGGVGMNPAAMREETKLNLKCAVSR